MNSVLLPCRTKSVTVERAIGTGVLSRHGDSDDGDNEDVQKESELNHACSHSTLVSGVSTVQECRHRL